MEISTFTFPPRIEFGLGAIKTLGNWVRDLKSETPLIVTDDGVVKAGLVAHVQTSLDEADLTYEIYSNVQPNPLDRSALGRIQRSRSARRGYFVFDART